MPNPLKVMIVDDTIIYRKIVGDVVSEIPDCEVTGTASNGELALRKMRLSLPDLVLLDVEMPVMDGLETLKQIKRLYPSVGVIMVSGVSERQAAITLEALSNGAVDFVPKPTEKNFEASKKALAESLHPIITLFRNKHKSYRATAPRFLDASVSRKPDTIARPAEPEFRPAPLPIRFDVLVIGVSTGGPNALAEFIPALPGNLNIPVLLVQHMPPMFTRSLADHLNRLSALEVSEAIDEEEVLRNHVYIAPGGKHMTIASPSPGLRQIRILDTPPVNSCKPSVDVLFDTIPDSFGTNVLSIIMTGMGSDGMNGVRTLKSRGCFSITQSADSCVVYGMPRAVDEAGLSDESISLDRLAPRVLHLIQKGRL